MDIFLKEEFKEWATTVANPILSKGSASDYVSYLKKLYESLFCADENRDNIEEFHSLSELINSKEPDDNLKLLLNTINKDKQHKYWAVDKIKLSKYCSAISKYLEFLKSRKEIKNGTGKIIFVLNKIICLFLTKHIVVAEYYSHEEMREIFFRRLKTQTRPSKSNPFPIRLFVKIISNIGKNCVNLPSNWTSLIIAKFGDLTGSKIEINGIRYDKDKVFITNKTTNEEEVLDTKSKGKLFGNIGGVILHDLFDPLIDNIHCLINKDEDYQLFKDVEKLYITADGRVWITVSVNGKKIDKELYTHDRYNKGPFTFKYLTGHRITKSGAKDKPTTSISQISIDHIEPISQILARIQHPTIDEILDIYSSDFKKMRNKGDSYIAKVIYEKIEGKHNDLGDGVVSDLRKIFKGMKLELMETTENKAKGAGIPPAKGASIPTAKGAGLI
jgi:hypothetical protein